MSSTDSSLAVPAALVGGFAVAVAYALDVLQPITLCIIIAVACVMALLGIELVSAHHYRAFIRAYGSNRAWFREGSLFVFFPQYVVTDPAQFGPWSKRKRLPLVGQVLAIDVPEVMVPVENGVYCLRVNTKVMGVVESYTVSDLVQNPVSVEDRCHDVIAQALRARVHDKPLEEAMAEIQRLFLQDAESVSKLLSVPAFRPTQLSLDADMHVQPGDQATTQGLELVVQRRQEAARRMAVEAAMETERQKVELHKVELQQRRDDFMLQQEAYGREGAAMIEAAKHAKALYLFSGGQGPAASTVLTLPG